MTFSVKHTLVEINFRFAAVLTFLLLLFPDGNAAVCFLLCLLHESGHLIMLVLFHCPPEKLCFDFFGMKITTAEKMISPLKEITVAAAGPLMNLSAALILYKLSFENEAVMSFGLAVFNLLPVPMLDGGHILACFVNKKALEITGICVAIILLAVGILTAFTTKNFTIFIVAVYILIGIRA